MRRNYTEIKTLNKEQIGKEVLVRGRVHTSRGTGNLTFLVIRQRVHTIQAIIAKTDTIPKEMVNFSKKIPVESMVDVHAVVRAPEEVSQVDSCTQGDVELTVHKIFVVSEAETLPIQLLDCSVPSQIIKQQKQESQLLSNQIEQLKREEQTEEIKKQIQELEEKKEKSAVRASLSIFLK